MVVEVVNIPLSNFIQLIQNTNLQLPQFCTEKKTLDEGYEIKVDSDNEFVVITARTPTGALHGVHSFLSMMNDDTMEVPVGSIKDCPRFSYRGLHLDSARHFIHIEDMLKFIDAMSRYKLNKLHMHLTDDEGWRLQIPDLPELTDVSKACVL